MLRYLLSILIVITLLGNLFAQTQGQANIFLDSTNFLLGDHVSMQVVVNAPVGNTVLFPNIKELLEGEKLELVDQKETEVIQGDENNTFKKIIIFTAWEPGTYFVPAMSFSYQKGAEVVEIKSAPIQIKITAPTVTGDSTYVADIKTILAEEPNFWDNLYYFLTHPVTVAVIILLLAFLAFYAFMRYKNRAKPTAPLSPEELALQRLEILQQANPLGSKDFKDYHTQISFILRSYLNTRFKINALENPTAEFLPKAKAHELMPSSLYEEFATVLEHADLIKFAKASPLEIANKKAMDLSLELINSVQEKLRDEKQMK